MKGRRSVSKPMCWIHYLRGGMSNIFLYIAVYIMYFLAMALHCQYNKHIILPGVDNCTTIQFTFFNGHSSSWFWFEDWVHIYMQHMGHRFGCINKIIAAVFIILTGTRQRRDRRIERRRLTAFANRCWRAFSTSAAVWHLYNAFPCI